MGLLQDITLMRCEDRNIPCPPTLGPGRIQGEVVAAVGVARLELNGLFAAEAKGRLEHEAHTDINIGYSAKRIVRNVRPQETLLTWTRRASPLCSLLLATTPRFPTRSAHQRRALKRLSRVPVVRPSSCQRWTSASTCFGFRLSALILRLPSSFSCRAASCSIRRRFACVA